METVRCYKKMNLLKEGEVACDETVDIPLWVYEGIAIEAQMALIKRLEVGYQGAYPALTLTLNAMKRDLYNNRRIK